ncbi:MAG: shikimate kinase, partial [Bacteroidota bacterium]
MLIFFVGYIETRKKIWGQKLAKELNYDFVDTRDLMTDRTGVPYGDLLKNKELYINLEQEVLSEVLKLENTVVATSELLPGRADNMDKLNTAGKTVFLRAGLGCIMMRVSKIKNDIPLLDGIDPDIVPDFISMELKRRNPVYAKAQFNKL